MYEHNLFLIQVEHANSFALSEWPQEKRLGLILLDNLFELYLNKSIQSIFDRDGSFSERKYTSEYRAKVLSTFPNLLKFALSQKIINKDERTCLSFVHEIRNETYHRHQRWDNVQVNIGLKIASDLIRESPSRWLASSLMGSMNRPGYGIRYEGIEFLNRDIITNFNKTVTSLLSFDTKLSAQEQISALISEEIRSLRNSLKSLTSELENDFDFNVIFMSHWSVSKFQIPTLKDLSKDKQLIVILTFYEILSTHEEILRDEKDEGERFKKFEKLWRKKTSTLPKFPISQLSKINLKNLGFKHLSVAQAIDKLKNFQSHYINLLEAVTMADGDLSAYGEFLYEYYAGK